MKLFWACLLFALLLAAFTGVAAAFGVTGSLAKHFPSALLSFALILAPYWFFGFGLAHPLRLLLDRPAKRLGAATLLTIPYLVFVLPRGAFDPVMFLALMGAILSVAAVLELGYDFLALLLLAAAVELPYFRNAWPAPGLSGVSKLLFVDLGLFGFLVIRPTAGIGFVLQISFRDVKIGLREFLFFLPIALPLGFVFQFLNFHPAGFDPIRVSTAWLFTLFFIAIPEEIFFRGLILNLLERRWGTRKALIATSLLFGLAHFPKRAIFNWRYVILAAIAGFFYGRAWLDRRRVLTSGITHATVDTVWSIWLR